MATLKTTVKTKLKTGMYIVYIRVLHNRQTAYVRTSWMVDSAGISPKSKEVTDPYILQQASTLISRYYDMLNRVDISDRTAYEVVTYLTKVTEDLSFSDYVRKHIEKMIARGQERTSRNYKWALNHLERFAESDNIMFSRFTPAFINRWIETLMTTNRCKEQYPVCMREVYRAAMREFNDEDKGIVKIKNIWNNVTIPRCDEPEKRAIPASLNKYCSKEKTGYRLKKDYIFDAPSTAASYALGRSANGWTEFKDKNNITLDSAYR